MLKIYDPQVKFEQIQMDLSLEKFAWDGPAHTLKATYAPGHPCACANVLCCTTLFSCRSSLAHTSSHAEHNNSTLTADNA